MSIKAEQYDGCGFGMTLNSWLATDTEGPTTTFLAKDEGLTVESGHASYFRTSNLFTPDGCRFRRACQLHFLMNIKVWAQVYNLQCPKIFHMRGTTMSCLLKVYSKDTNSLWEVFESINNQANPCAGIVITAWTQLCKAGKMPKCSSKMNQWTDCGLSLHWNIIHPLKRNKTLIHSTNGWPLWIYAKWSQAQGNSYI